MPHIRADLITLGQALRSFREERGWTQERLYLKSGLATPLISGGENGKRNLSFQTLERWLSALGVSWEDFGATVHRMARKRGP